ncbi:DUF3667 domain-containing protein [Psychroserpens luteus]|uniref:DUF3667 domain-containing protein n=1 Tax=Psychroserpens luteus TaxID=1434066 RepID=A0ABW5ZP26_9FLAO|nr:DUF3667 domain-containing protein [Psychroserpens luteus]
MTCISCNKFHDENYCPNCGEKNGIKKITFSSIIEDAFSTITNMDKGFLFNLKALFLNPKKITTNFISGKRKGILNPISYLIISITIYLIVINVFKAPPEEVTETTTSAFFASGQKIGNAVGLFLRTYIKYFWILSIIPLGFSLKLVYQKYNFLEYVAISSFVIGQATIVGVISFLIFRFPLIFDPFVYLTIAWLSYRIFKDNTAKIASILLSFVSLFLFIIQLVIITACIAFVIS